MKSKYLAVSVLVLALTAAGAFAWKMKSQEKPVSFKAGGSGQEVAQVEEKKGGHTTLNLFVHPKLNAKTNSLIKARKVTSVLEGSFPNMFLVKFEDGKNRSIYLPAEVKVTPEDVHTIFNVVADNLASALKNSDVVIFDDSGNIKDSFIIELLTGLNVDKEIFESVVDEDFFSSVYSTYDVMFEMNTDAIMQEMDAMLSEIDQNISTMMNFHNGGYTSYTVQQPSDGGDTSTATYYEHGVAAGDPDSGATKDEFGRTVSDRDTDNDGIRNGDDTDADGDGIPNTTDTDDDNDGINDEEDDNSRDSSRGITAESEGGVYFINDSMNDLILYLDSDYIQELATQYVMNEITSAEFFTLMNGYLGKNYSQIELLGIEKR